MNILFDQMQLKQKLIREFTPNWFAVVMGTGVVALILAHFPFASSSFYRLGMMLWIFNSALFIVFSVLYLARWFFYPEEAKQILSHPTMSLFLGTIPMALATVLNGFLSYGMPLFGELAVLIALKLWYLDVLLAILVGWIVPFCMFSRQQHTLPSMTAMWLLPIVAAEVAASSGGLILNVAPDLPNAVTILWGSYLLWGMSVLPAFLILAIWFYAWPYIRSPKKNWRFQAGYRLARLEREHWQCCYLDRLLHRFCNSIIYNCLGLFCSIAVYSLLWCLWESVFGG